MNGITIKVNVQRLMRELENNRTNHASTYEKAKAGYLKVTKQKLSDLLDRVAAGEMVERVWLDAPPDDHTSDYDDVIAMMQWATDVEIELTQAQFKQYVMDDWGWKEQWMTTNTSYLQA